MSKREQSRRTLRDFLGSSVVRNPPSNAGQVGSIPGWGTEISHVKGQLSSWTATTEPKHWNKDVMQPKKKKETKYVCIGYEKIKRKTLR